jgi:hypothetical protein
MKSITVRRVVSVAMLSILFTGCASVAVTDDAIQTNTAAALGLEKGSFTISDRVNDGVKSSYTVKTNAGRKYACYVTGTITTFGRTVSDAICNEVGKPAKQVSGSSGSSSSCNALLKAAGKC